MTQAITIARNCFNLKYVLLFITTRIVVNVLHKFMQLSDPPDPNDALLINGDCLGSFGRAEARVDFIKEVQTRQKRA